MKIHTQNLTDGKQPIWAYGRAWLWRRNNRGHYAHVEWATGRHANGFSLTMSFGGGDDDCGIMFHVCLPWIISIFIGLDEICHCKKECRTGIAIHNGSIWFYPLSYVWDSDRKDPWYRKHYSWSFPWDWDWYSTEVLEHKDPIFAKTVWVEKRGEKGKDPFDAMRLSEPIKKSVSETYDYTYILKNGTVQHRLATVFVDRMTWRMRWWWFLPFKKTRTCISVTFND